MAPFPKVVESKHHNHQESQQRISAVTAGIVNRILDTQLPTVMKTMSPRRITGLNSHNGFFVPKIEHVKEVNYERYKVSEQKDTVTAAIVDSQHRSNYTRLKMETPEYVCFINHGEPEIPDISYKQPSGWGGRKRKAPPPRVKSMDELLLEESLRRNSRSLTRVPDLRVKGDFAPGYSCKWERLKHLPDIKPTKQPFERQPTAADALSMYKDADANFSQNRVEEILKSEGFISSGREMTHADNRSSSKHINSITLDNEFGNQSFRISAQPKLFSISASRVEPLKSSSPKRQSKSSSHTGESLAILQTRKKLPNLIINPVGKAKPD